MRASCRRSGWAGDVLIPIVGARGPCRAAARTGSNPEWTQSSTSRADPKVAATGASADSTAWAYVRKVIEGFAWPRRFATVRMSWPWVIDIVADQCRRSCRRHLASTLARSGARRHHVLMRSGLTGTAPTANIQGPKLANYSRSSSRRHSVVGSSDTTRRFAVFVGSSRKMGLVRCSLSRITAMLESMVRRPSLRSSHRSAASSERRAPVTAAKRRATRACGSIWWSIRQRHGARQHRPNVLSAQGAPGLGLAPAETRDRHDVRRQPPPPHRQRDGRRSAVC